VFGVPRLHEDDPLRAVRATVELRLAMEELNAELDRDWGVTLHTRTGVNTGEVVAGDPAGGQALVTGDAVNVAARLEQLAGSDEILIGEATHRLTANAIQAERVPPLEARGKSTPLQAWRLQAVLGHEPYRRRLEMPLVDRRDELAQLRDAYGRCIRQRSCALFTIVGPAGIGKSRLTMEFLRSVEGEAQVLTGRCLPYGEGITYWPLVEILRRVAGDDVEGGVRAVMDGDADADQVALLMAAVAGSSQQPAIADDVSWAARRLFETLSRQRPLVISFEDVNWAEPTLLDLIGHVAEWARESPLMLLCSARNELLERRSTWAGGLRNATTALLEPLSDDDSADMVAQLRSDEPLAEDTRLRVIALAGGNPLFVEQLLATMGTDQQPDVTALSTIHAVISARLDALPAGEREVLECASVMGKEFGGEPLSATLGGDAGEALTALVRKDLIRPTRSAFHGRAAYRFGHLLVRDSAYGRIPKRRRAELHERFVEWMRASGVIDEAGEVAGYHLEQAYLLRTQLGPADDAARELGLRAGRALTEAGMRAQRRLDAPAAANLLGRAAALLAGDREARLELLPDLALAQLRLDQTEQARAVLDEALSLSIELADSRNEQRALLGHAYLLWTATGDGSELERTAARAVPVLEQAGDAAGLVRAWLWRGFAHQSRSQYAEAVSALEQARHHLAAAGGVAEERSVFGNLALSLWLSATPCDQAIARCRALIEQERGRHSTAEAHVAIPLAMLLAGSGQSAAAYQVLAAAGDLFDRTPGTSRSEIAHYTGVVHLTAGDLVAAEDSLRSGIALAQEHPGTLNLTDIEAALATVLCEGGRFAEALDLAERSRLHAAPGDVGNQIGWRQALARASAGVDKTVEAVALAGQAVELAEGTDSPILQADALLAQAEVLARAGQPDQSRDSAARALERYRQKGITSWAERAEAMLAGAPADTPRTQ
jgi:tetratricopeptide (TPR) repeat protein